MYQIRSLESSDLLHNIQHVEETTAAMPPLELWLRPDHISLVAAGPEGPAGAILLIPCRQVGYRVAKFRLGWVYVLKEHRKAGLGRKLIETAVAEAARRGATAIQISLKPENQPFLSWTSSLPKVPGVGYVVSLERCVGF